MPNLVYDTPTPPSQLYSSSAAIAGGAFPVTSLRPRGPQPVVTSTVLPKSRLREQYRPEMDYDLDTSSSSDSTFSSTDLAAGNHHNNTVSPRNKQNIGRTVEIDENHAPNGYYRSPGFGDAGMGPGMNDKQRFMDVRQQSRQQQQRGTYLSTRVDEHSDATLDSSSQSTVSESDDDIATRAREQQQSAYPNKPSATTGNLTSTPYPGPGVSSNNISKSAFDGMARELRKEFDRIMHAGQEPTHQNNSNMSKAPITNPSPPAFRNRRDSAIHRDSIPTSPSYVQQAPTPLPRGVMPRRPSSANVTRPVNRDHERTPPTQRTFGQEIRFPRQNSSPALPLQDKQSRVSPPKTTVAQHEPSWQSYQPTSPFRAPETAAAPGTIPPNNTRASDPSLYRAAESPSRLSNASSSYPALRVPDVTGLTEGLTSPSRADSGPGSHRNFATSRGSPVFADRRFPSSQEDPALSSALSGLKRRLEALESENARSEARVAELQDRLASQQGLTTQHHPLLSGETDPNAFVKRLQNEIDGLQQKIQDHNQTLNQLQVQQPTYTSPDSFTSYNPNSWYNVFTSLREALQHLADQVLQVRRVLEEVLQAMKNSTPHIMRDADLLRPANDQPVISHQTVHAVDSPEHSGQRDARVNAQAYQYPPAQPSKRLSPPLRSSSAPIPLGYNAEYRVPRTVSNPLPPSSVPQNELREREPLLERAERILSSLPPRSASHALATCATCQGRTASGDKVNDVLRSSSFDDSHAGRRNIATEQELPMQTVVTRALRDLEEDFAVHKRIYIDLSEEFKNTDPATPDVSRRKILANHLRESIDILEMKADEIKRLYNLLHYRSEMQSASEYEKMRSLARQMNTRIA